ncbi:hypothetical protein VNO78_19169 [Psophocarpus tetragonolobus]|uniref:Uncharacterized protein n=1 Tax=Psophocarpus tetragonolobus TaxID=3891 RepID=A0AAN9S8G5_PSOTE
MQWSSLHVMDRKVKPFYVTVVLVLLCLNLELLCGIEGRPLEVRELDSTIQRMMMAMLHSGPSQGGKGHKSETRDAPIPRQLKQSVPRSKPWH